jgi:PAS domain S-box-containing protein
MAISRDVTERRHAEEQIAEQAALLDEARDAIAVRDLDGRILFWNKGAERMYGWTREEVLGRNMDQVLYINPATIEMAHGLVLKHGEWSGNILHLAKDKHELMIEARCTLLRDKDGHPKSILGIYTDVTEKKSFEAQLMRAQRIESIGTLAGGIAHDLNNILTPILTSIEVLKLRESDPRNKHILETIEASSKRGADIVRQVLSFARGIKGERVEIKPKRLLKDIETLITDRFPKDIRMPCPTAAI